MAVNKKVMQEGGGGDVEVGEERRRGGATFSLWRDGSSSASPTRMALRLK